MKSIIKIFLIILLIHFFSCKKEDTVPLPEPPIANFSPTGGVICSSIGLLGVEDQIADVTTIQFQNNSTGDIDTYQWEFEDGLDFSSVENPSYIFDFEGIRTVKLTVNGPGGIDSTTCDIRILASPICSGLEESSTYTAEVINFFRDNNLVQSLNVRVTNSFSNTVRLRTYHADDWLAGIYNNIIGYRDIDSGATEILTINSNEWGVQIVAANGGVSCVRIVGRVGFFDGVYFNIDTQDISDGVL